MNFFTHSIGARLKTERERLGLSQAEAASIGGIRREMWGKYERDQADPAVSVVAHFCAHGADPVFLMTGRNSTHPSPDTDTLRLSIQEVQAWQVRNQRFIDATKIADVVFAISEFANSEMTQVKPTADRVLRLVA